VLPFQASGAELKDVGAEVTSLVATHLSTEPGLVMVQRAELDKVLAEKELGLSGTVSPETAARIGNLTGAKVLVTGRVFAVRNELVLVAQVIGTDWRPITGLFACGEMIGGLFYDNYPAGTGLVSGATFGRIAGRAAAKPKSNSRAIAGAAA